MPAQAVASGFPGLDSRLRGNDDGKHQITPGMICLVSATLIM